MIDWAAYVKEQAAEKAIRDGFRAFDYTGEKCANCGRVRVLNCRNGRHICEKCNWDADRGEYCELTLGSLP